MACMQGLTQCPSEDSYHDAEDIAQSPPLFPISSASPLDILFSFPFQEALPSMCINSRCQTPGKAGYKMTRLAEYSDSDPSVGSCGTQDTCPL